MVRYLYVYVVLPIQIKKLDFQAFEEAEYVFLIPGGWMMRTIQNFLCIAEASSLRGNIHLLVGDKRERKGPLFILLSNSKTQVSRKCLWSSPVEKVATETAAIT